MITGPLFLAKSIALWSVDHTPLVTLVTDADMPLGKVRESMMRDLNAVDRRVRRLPCAEGSYSFQGIRGTHVHGRGWKLHVPKDTPLGLAQAIEIATMRDWMDVTPEYPNARVGQEYITGELK